MERRHRTQTMRRDQRGFTVVELAIALTTMAILSAISIGTFRQYAEATSARKAAVQIAADIALTRSFAIQRRENVSLVMDESDLAYVVRDEAGTVLTRRAFNVGSEVMLDLMTLNTSGDSLTFNSRGLLNNGTAQVVVGRRSRSHQVDVNALGRTTLN